MKFRVLQGSMLIHIITVYSLQPHCWFELFMTIYLLHLQMWKMTHFQMKDLLCNAKPLFVAERTNKQSGWEWAQVTESIAVSATVPIERFCIQGQKTREEQ